LQLVAADLLKLGVKELAAHVGSDALKEICHDNSQTQGPQQNFGGRT
jgi:hypothetical protein